VLSPVSVISKVVRVGRVTVEPPVPAWASSPPIPMTALFRSEDLASFTFVSGPGTTRRAARRPRLRPRSKSWCGRGSSADAISGSEAFLLGEGAIHPLRQELVRTRWRAQGCNGDGLRRYGRLARYAHPTARSGRRQSSRGGVADGPRRARALLRRRSELLGVSGLAGDRDRLVGSEEPRARRRRIPPVPHQPRVGIARRRTVRPGRHRVRRKCWPSCGIHPWRNLPPRLAAGRRPRPGGEPSGRATAHAAGKPRHGVGSPPPTSACSSRAAPRPSSAERA
jgi:hypothetical protein